MPPDYALLHADFQPAISATPLARVLGRGYQPIPAQSVVDTPTQEKRPNRNRDRALSSLCSKDGHVPFRKVNNPLAALECRRRRLFSLGPVREGTSRKWRRGSPQEYRKSCKLQSPSGAVLI